MKKNWWCRNFSELTYIGIVIAIVITVFLFFNDAAEYNKAMKENLGKPVVVLNDTLIVTDYSFMSNSYYLSNGALIDVSLYESLKVYQ